MARVRQTWCKVKIVTPQLVDQDSRTYELDPKSPRTSALHGLTSVSVEQTMTGANTFQLTFAPERIEEGESWAALIPQYSLVFIEMGSSDEDGADPLVMIGLTSPGVESEHWQGSAPQRQVVIPGLGIERVLDEAGIYRAPWLELHSIEPELDRKVEDANNELLTHQPMWALQLWQGAIDPREALLRILFYFLVDHKHAFVNLLLPFPYRVRDLLVPGDYSDADVEAVRLLVDLPLVGQMVARIPSNWRMVDRRLKLFTHGMPPQSTVAGYLHACLDLVFHEWFVRYQNGKARIHHRPKPFASRADADAAVRMGETLFADGVPDLATVTINSGDVMQSQIVVGSQPIYNLFMAMPADGSTLEGGRTWREAVRPEFCGRRSDHAYHGRYGLRPLEHTSPYINYDHGMQDVAVATEISRELNQVLKSWYDPQPLLRQGSLICLGRAAFRVGSRLVWDGADINGRSDGRWMREFYVEAVKHTYDFATGAFVSALTVTRGWQLGGEVGPDGERVLPGKKPRPAPPPPEPTGSHDHEDDR